MKREDIIYLQKRIGAEPDGYWGPQSIKACHKHLKRYMPSPNPWPKPDDTSMRRFYGPPGEDRLVSLAVPRTFNIRYNNAIVESIRCHELVADSLLRVLTEIASGPEAWVLKEYAGCYNYRSMRTSSRMSKHAWGVAIDLAPNKNGLYIPWPERATMPLEIMEAFARESWVGLGWQIGRDAMHFEACSP